MFLVRLLLCLGLTAAGAHAVEHEEVYPRDADPLMGNYEGRWNAEEDVDPEIAAQVIPLGGSKYRLILVPKLHLRYPPLLDIEVEAEDNALKFSDSGIEGVVTPEGITGGRRVGTKKFEMKKVELLSPTLGVEAPEGATVLFDGAGLDAWEPAEGWSVLEDGTLLVAPQGDDLLSKAKYKSAKMHLEFRLPYMPRSRGQSRGNSGVFLQDTYEVQILDSYGLEGYNNECGALYKVSPPQVNACAPPLQWQTYDITYHAPKFNADGSVAEFARITVLQNGILIQNDIPLPWITGWKEEDRLKPPPTEPGSIRLQNHNNFVEFRNIRIQELPE